MAGSTAKPCQSSRVQPGAADLLAHHGVGVAQDLEPLRGDLADDADREARARERLAPDDLVGQAELLADAPHLVLEQQRSGSTSSKSMSVGQAADVVVRLDLGRASFEPDSMTSE